jgi:hypothetical protein
MAFWSDLLGFLGALLLIVGPARDQISRRRISSFEPPPGKSRPPSMPKTTPLDVETRAAASQMRAEAGRWNFLDSLSMALGAALLAVSFLMSAIDHYR